MSASAPNPPCPQSPAAPGYASELERRVEGTKDGLDGRGAGGLLRISDSVTLILGDCLAHLPIEADAVISDPPYGIDYSPGGGGTGPRKAFTNADKVIGDDKPFLPEHLIGLAPIVVLWGGSNFAGRLPSTRGWLVWDKKCGIYEENQFSDCELAWTNQDSPIKIYRHRWTGYHRDSERGEHHHPTQKPVALMAWCMERAKVPHGATVLDPYMGSGSTGIACIRTGRKFIGIERDPKHFETAVQRIRKELEECVFEFPKGQDGGEQQQALELEPRQTHNGLS